MVDGLYETQKKKGQTKNKYTVYNVLSLKVIGLRLLVYVYFHSFHVQSNPLLDFSYI